MKLNKLAVLFALGLMALNAQAQSAEEKLKAAQRLWFEEQGSHPAGNQDGQPC